MSNVGPMPLTEHLLWLCVLSLVVSLVYNGLREESVAAAAARGVRRWGAFLLGCAGLAVGVRLVGILFLS